MSNAATPERMTPVRDPEPSPPDARQSIPAGTDPTLEQLEARLSEAAALVQEGAAEARRWAREHPLTAMAGAAAAGYLIAKLISSGWRR